LLLLLLLPGRAKVVVVFDEVGIGGGKACNVMLRFPLVLPFLTSMPTIAIIALVMVLAVTQ
jgi:hypothetical protein